MKSDFQRRRYPKRRPIAIDLFCGAGGLSLGLEQAGFDIALGVDIDGHHVATHERNFPYGKSLCISLVDLDAEKIREVLGFEDEIDAVVGGPPCQGFSNMGLRDRKDPRNSLIDHFVRIVLELRPKTFAMENVPGMMSGETRKILDAVIEATQAAGYRLALPVRVLDALDFGVPQQRRRLFLLGVRSDVSSRIEYPTGKCEGQPERPTVWEAIADLPDIDRDLKLYRQDSTRYSRAPKSTYAKVARGIVEDSSDLSRPRDWDSTICSGCLRTLHSPQSVELYSATVPGEVVPGHKLPRLHPKGICPTLRAGSDSKHGSYTAPRPIHPKRPRCISAREAARLHGYPDWFSFYPLKWHAYRQIGNSVCPPVARAIGYALRAVLGDRTTIAAPSVIRLDDAFILPHNRPRSLKRIPQIKQFPPVIEYLFERAYDKKAKRLRKASFSFEEVTKAIAATGVDLHWVREDTFLQEIARSRRVNCILAAPLARGYSIISYGERNAIGKFVPIGTAGTLGEQEMLRVNIADLKEPDRLALSSGDFENSEWGITALFTQPLVQRRLWRRDDSVVGPVVGTGNRNGGTGRVFTMEVRHSPKFSPELAAVITCKAATLPTKARIKRLGKETNAESVTILVNATAKHLIAMQYDECSKSPRETARAAFEFDGNGKVST